MGKRLTYILLFLTLITLILSCEGPRNPVESPSTIALIHGFLIDGTGHNPLSDATVIIQDSRITQVSSSEYLEIPTDAYVIDLDGAAILPGFINAHVHGGFDAANLRAWAREGVTTVRDLGANPRRPLEAIRQDLASDPQNARLVYAGPLITVPGGYPIVPFGSGSALPVTSVENANEQANTLLDNGADVLKIALERGDAFLLEIPVLSAAEAAAICSVAHDRGTVVSAHILAARDIELAIAAGANDLAHMSFTAVSGETIDQLVEREICWVPTLELWHGADPGTLPQAIDNLHRFVNAGGKVALGTDYDGYTTPFELGMPLREIGLMGDAGMTPMQIIVAATKNAAQVCNLADELGTIETGKIADILVVYTNPLHNITNELTRVQLVIHNGNIIVDNR